MKKVWIPHLYAIIASLLWASTAAVAKLLIQDVSGIQLAFFSFLFSTISLLFIVIATKKILILKTYTTTDIFRMIGIGLLGCYLYYIFFYNSLLYIPAQKAFIINYLWPIFTVLFTRILLKEKIQKYQAIGLILGFIGVCIITTTNGSLDFNTRDTWGILLAFMGAIFYGLFSALGKKYSYETYTSMLIFYLTSFTAISITIFTFSSIPPVSFNELLGFAWLGIMTNAVAFIFWFKALKYGHTATVANIIYLTPFLSLLYIFLLNGEKISPYSILGLLVIFSGVIIQSIKQKTA